MGPISGNYPGFGKDIVRHAHGDCQNKSQCTGPGCRMRTGKTAFQKLPRKTRIELRLKMQDDSDDQDRVSL